MAKNVFAGFSDDDEVIIKDDSKENKSGEKTAEQLEAERIAAENIAKSKDEKSPEDIEKERLASEEKDKNKNGKTQEEIDAEIASTREEKYKGKTEAEIAEIEAKENEISLELKFEDDDPDSKDKDKGVVKTIDYKSIAKNLGLTLEDEITELTEDAFVEKVKEKIESSKEKFNYQHIPEDTLDVVKFFAEEGGTVADLLTDHDVVLAEVYLSMDSEAKFVKFQSEQLIRAGFDEESAAGRAQELWDQKSEKDQAQAIKQIDTNILAFKNQAIKEVVDRRKEIVAKEKSKAVVKAQAEKTQMIGVVKGMSEFMGMPIPKEVNDQIVRQIENGNFDKVLNSSTAKARVNAYMMEKFGKQILETQKKILGDTSRASYNNGVQKLIDKNHNAKPERKEKGQQTEVKAGKYNFTDIDSQ